MIPCYICGRDVAGGWIAGLPPAPDSQKTGLCVDHDSVVNRAIAFSAWQDLLAKDIAVQNEIHEQEADQPPVKLAIKFLDGGKIIIESQSFGLVNNTILEVLDIKGEKQYYPLQHIRSYYVISASKV